MTDSRREMDRIFAGMRHRPAPVMAEVIERTVASLGIEGIFYAYMEGYYHTRDLRTLDRAQLKALFHHVEACAALLDDADFAMPTDLPPNDA